MNLPWYGIIVHEKILYISKTITISLIFPVGSILMAKKMIETREKTIMKEYNKYD